MGRRICPTCLGHLWPHLWGRGASGPQSLLGRGSRPLQSTLMDSEDRGGLGRLHQLSGTCGPKRPFPLSAVLILKARFCQHLTDYRCVAASPGKSLTPYNPPPRHRHLQGRVYCPWTLSSCRLSRFRRPHDFPRYASTVMLPSVDVVSIVAS